MISAVGPPVSGDALCGYKAAMNLIFVPGQPRPAGHYSPAIAHGDLLFVSGQLPIVPGETPDPSRPITAQVELVMANLERVLVEGGSALDRLLSVTIYVTDIGEWDRIDAAYAAILGEHRPARAIVPVPALHFGLAIEIQAIGVIATL